MEYKNPFEVLEVPDSVDQNELYEAYKSLKNKYANMRFEVGEAGRLACEKLDAIEMAYKEADQIVKSRYYEEKFGNPLQEVEILIKNNQLDLAQEKLDNANNHNAEWHYYQSIIFFKKEWIQESRKQLEQAIKLDPINKKYNDSLKELDTFINNSKKVEEESFYKNAYDNQGKPNNNKQRSYQNPPPNGRVGGCTPCDCCNGLCMADCCCECMGGDLISCC